MNIITIIITYDINIMDEDPVTHVTLTVSRNKQPLWKLEGHNTEEYEMIAGMAHAISGFLETRQIPDRFSDVINVEVDSTDMGQYNLNGIWDILTDFGIADHPSFYSAAKEFVGVYEIEGQYGWGRTVSPEGQFLIDVFVTPRYIQGFIMGCNACGMDFRQVRYGKPFRVAADGHITYYDIVGYPMTNPPDMPTQI